MERFWLANTLDETKSESWHAGVVWGCLGMLGFSGTLVATRIVVADFSPVSITAARIVIAAFLGVSYLTMVGGLKIPERKYLVSLFIMGLGLAVGFPFFIALAMEEVPAVHGAVISGLAPAATALVAVIRTGERPSPIFWIACGVGFLTVLYFAFDAGGGYFVAADVWLLLAMLSLGVAYVEGGLVSAAIGGSAALSWAMILLSPIAAVLLIWSLQDTALDAVSIDSWSAMAYLGIVSMFLASVFWYRGLALGGIARIGQINLILPVMAIIWAAIFLGEPITLIAVSCAIIVFVAMAVCLKTKVKRN